MCQKSKNENSRIEKHKFSIHECKIQKMKNQIKPLIQMLFVFNKWTLMIDSKDLSGLEPGSSIEFYDSNKDVLFRGKASKFLRSNNPQVQPVELELPESTKNVKLAKYFSLI